MGVPQLAGVFFAMENAAGVFQCSTVKLPERGLSTEWIVAVTTWNPSSNQPAMVVKPYGRARNPYRTNSWNWLFLVGVETHWMVHS